MQGVILAGGEGSRLGSLTKDRPKVLVSVGERRLIDHSIAFLRKLQADEIIVVGGYHADALGTYLEKAGYDIKFVENEEYQRESLSTFAKALPILHDDVIQIDSDFIYRKSVGEDVANCLGGDAISLICTSDTAAITSDMVKVSTDDRGVVVSVGKEVTPHQYGYTGMFYCPKEKLDVLKDVVTGILRDSPQGAKLWSMFPMIVDAGEEVMVADIGGFEAIEVDTPEELEEAKRFITEHNADISSYFR